MVVQGNPFGIALLVIEERHVIGDGRVLQGEPILPSVTQTFNSSGVLKLPS